MKNKQNKQGYENNQKNKNCGNKNCGNKNCGERRDFSHGGNND